MRGIDGLLLVNKAEAIQTNDNFAASCAHFPGAAKKPLVPIPGEPLRFNKSVWAIISLDLGVGLPLASNWFNTLAILLTFVATAKRSVALVLSDKLEFPALIGVETAVCTSNDAIAWTSPPTLSRKEELRVATDCLMSACCSDD